MERKATDGVDGGFTQHGDGRGAGDPHVDVGHTFRVAFYPVQAARQREPRVEAVELIPAFETAVCVQR